MSRIPLKFLRERREAREKSCAEEKVRLEIRELRRSQWLRPAVIIPSIITAATLAVSTYLGVFDVERKRIELQSKELAIQALLLQSDIKNLTQQREELRKDRAALSRGNAEVSLQIAELRRVAATVAAQLDRPAAEPSRSFEDPHTLSMITFPEFADRVFARCLETGAYELDGAYTKKSSRGVVRASNSALSEVTGGSTSDSSSFDSSELRLTKFRACMIHQTVSVGSLTALDEAQHAALRARINSIADEIDDRARGHLKDFVSWQADWKRRERLQAAAMGPGAVARAAISPAPVEVWLTDCYVHQAWLATQLSEAFVLAMRNAFFR